jgi:hypothetical protein
VCDDNNLTESAASGAGSSVVASIPQPLVLNRAAVVVVPPIKPPIVPPIKLRNVDLAKFSKKSSPIKKN